MSADLTDSVVSAKTQTSSSTVSVDDILQEANQIKKEQHLPIATSQDDDENSWTLAIYMCGSDLERDKAAGTRDLCEMLGAQHKMEGDNRDLDNLNLIVMTGGAGRMSPAYTPWRRKASEGRTPGALSGPSSRCRTARWSGGAVSWSLPTCR